MSRSPLLEHATAPAACVRMKGGVRWRGRLVPADAVEAVDERTRVIRRRIERSAIGAFL